jgi:dipeptidyl aminopeptidase/acylaminoacyl peptidase
MPRLLPILGVALLGLGLLTGCAGEDEEKAAVTPTPTAAAVATLEATPSPEATPAATATATPGATATPTVGPAAGLGKLAFVRDGNIWVLDVDGGQETQLTTDGQNWWPEWSADGEWIAFRKRLPQDESETLTQVWTMRADGSGATKIADSAQSNIDWSPVSARLAYASEDGALWAVDADGANRIQLLPPGDEIWRIAWSPDGKRLAVERWIQGKELTPPPNMTVEQGIWLVNADGSGLSKLYGPYQRSQLGPVAYLGDWSPDGKRLSLWPAAFISASLMADGAPLASLAVEGGEAQQIASFTLLEPGFVAWSPQGDRLAVVEGGGRETWVDKQIVVTQPDGGDRVLLSDAGRADLAPAWSPDGQRIAFTSGESSESDTAYENPPEMLRTRRIWLASSDGSDKRQLTNDPAYADGFPQWSADGAHILFVRQQAEAINMDEELAPVEIWLMKADGSEQHKLVGGLSNGWFGYYGFVDWSQLLDWHR